MWTGKRVGELLKQTGKWEEQAVELDRKMGAGFQILTSKKRRLASKLPRNLLVECYITTCIFMLKNPLFLSFVNGSG
jgi:hypothetical protein